MMRRVARAGALPLALAAAATAVAAASPAAPGWGAGTAPLPVPRALPVGEILPSELDPGPAPPPRALPVDARGAGAGPEILGPPPEGGGPVADLFPPPDAMPGEVTAAAEAAGVLRALPVGLGWGAPLRIEDRPEQTRQAAGPGRWAGTYRLGPGDVLTIAVQGDPHSRRNAVEVGPDGELSYLQARRVAAEGKTVPELRDALEAALAEHHENPTVLIAPIGLKSKRYTLLGKVAKSGTFPLERPTTLLEAIARGGGFAVGSSRLGVAELADLRRSFVVRGGEKLGIDFERLYAQGDLTQNAYLEPGDYIYVASNVDQHAYVFGSVVSPGEVSLDTPLTVTGALAEAQGFTEKAWKARVLLVRGKLSDPTTQVVDMRAVLRGEANDQALAPGDIVYVGDRPWAVAEDLLDAAIRSFIQGSAAAAFETRTSISVR